MPLTALTLTVTVPEAPPESVPRLQVTVWPLAVPPPVALVKVSPAGKVSVMVTLLAVPVPLF